MEPTHAAVEEGEAGGVLSIHERWRQRVLSEIVEAAEKQGHQPEVIRNNFRKLDNLLVSFKPSLDLMRPNDWAKLAADVDGLAYKIIMLKTHMPTLDMQAVMNVHPKLLLKTTEELESNVLYVSQVLAKAKEPAAIIQQVPELLEPRMLLSVLVTLKRWWPKKDAVAVLEEDPDVIRRAQEKDIPFDPVFWDEDAQSWSAPSYNSVGKLEDWQKFIRKKVYHQKAADIEQDHTFYNGIN